MPKGQSVKSRAVGKANMNNGNNNRPSRRVPKKVPTGHAANASREEIIKVPSGTNMRGHPEFDELTFVRSLRDQDYYRYRARPDQGNAGLAGLGAVRVNPMEMAALNAEVDDLAGLFGAAGGLGAAAAPAAPRGLNWGAALGRPAAPSAPLFAPATFGAAGASGASAAGAAGASPNRPRFAPGSRILQKPSFGVAMPLGRNATKNFRKRYNMVKARRAEEIAARRSAGVEGWGGESARRNLLGNLNAAAGGPGLPNHRNNRNENNAMTGGRTRRKLSRC